VASLPQAVGILGLATLLGLAWLLSLDRRRVRLRPVLWGLGLQLLLAQAVLDEAPRSLVGTFLLGLLVIGFLIDRGRHPLGSGWRYGLLVAAGSAAAAAALLALPAAALAAATLTLAGGLVLNSWRLRLEWLGRWGGALLVILGIDWMIVAGTSGRELLERLGRGIGEFLTLSDYGARFLFGNLADARYFFPGPEAAWPGFGYQFAFTLLPVIIFFGAFTSTLYYLGILQRVIASFGRFLRWTTGTSGAETLCATANIFIGQTEAPLAIRPYLASATRSELMAVMVGGFATIAGGGLAAYIALGIPAEHLVAASVMSAPAGLAVAKILLPELERSAAGGDVATPRIQVGDNVIEAATNGITDGLKLAVNVGAMLIGFIALIAVVDTGLSALDAWIDGRWLGGERVAYAASGMSPATGEFRGMVPGSLQTLFGRLLQPLAWLLGVPWAEAPHVGALLGIKLSLNEFVGYTVLKGYIEGGVLSPRSIALSTYALCGFANFASVGIQIGGLGALVPERRSELAGLGLRAMLGGALASWSTAAVAGLFL
jgi:CNT family concentrative nucleoside transporter